MQTFAGARNVSDGSRLEALYKDVACVIQGEEPTYSKEVVEKTRSSQQENCHILLPFCKQTCFAVMFLLIVR